MNLEKTFNKLVQDNEQRRASLQEWFEIGFPDGAMLLWLHLKQLSEEEDIMLQVTAELALLKLSEMVESRMRKDVEADGITSDPP